MDGPVSSYSPLVTCWFWGKTTLASIAPPIQAEYLARFSGMYSGGFTRDGQIAEAERFASLWNLSSKPWKRKAIWTWVVTLQNSLNKNKNLWCISYVKMGRCLSWYTTRQEKAFQHAKLEQCHESCVTAGYNIYNQFQPPSIIWPAYFKVWSTY